MHDWENAGCRTGGIQDRRNAGHEGLRTGGSQDRCDVGQV